MSRWTWVVVLATAVVVALVGMAPATALAAGTAAGTNITATASATYEDANGNEKNASGDVTVTVKQVAGVTVAAGSTAQWAQPNSSVVYPVTITNTGNASDTFSLQGTFDGDSVGWSAKIYHDADGDGVKDAEETTEVTDTGAIAADGTYKVLVVVSVPNGAADGAAEAVTFSATSQFDNAQSASQDVTTTVTDVVLSLSVSVNNTDPKPGDSVTYTFTLSNTGTGTASDISVSNAVPTNTSYNAGTIVLAGVGKTDANDGDGATYDSNTETFTFTPDDLAGGGQVIWKYTVTIDEFVDPDTTITNTGTVDFTDTAGNDQDLPFSNTGVTVGTKHLVSVTFNGTTNISAVEPIPGRTVTVDVQVQNLGNVQDTFNLELSWTEESFEWKLFADTDNDGVKDNDTAITTKVDDQSKATVATAAMDKNTSLHYVAELSVPGATVNGTADTFTVTATSQGDGNVSDNASQSLTVKAPAMSITIAADNTAPAPGDEIVYTVTATNNGDVDAQNVQLEVPVPTNTAYKAGSILVDDVACADATCFDAINDKVVVSAGTITVGSSVVVKFTVTVD